MYFICFDDKTGNCVAYAIDNQHHNVGEGKDDVVLEKDVVAPQDVILATKILQIYPYPKSAENFSIKVGSIEQAQKTWALFKSSFNLKYKEWKIVSKYWPLRGNSTYRNTNIGFVEFNNQLEQLKIKADELALRGYKNESSIAYKIVAKLQEYKIKFLTHKIRIHELQSKAKRYISSNREILEQHRGCKEIFVNLLAAVCTLFVPYLITAAIKGNLMLFHADTDSSDKLNKIDKSLDNLGDPNVSVFLTHLDKTKGSKPEPSNIIW